MSAPATPPVDHFPGQGGYGEEVQRLNRVLAAHLTDERLLSWVGTSCARFAAVVEEFGDGRVSLRRAVDLAAARKPEISASNYTTTPTPVPVDADEWEDEADEPEGVGDADPF